MTETKYKLIWESVVLQNFQGKVNLNRASPYNFIFVIPFQNLISDYSTK